jgi:hypothetical protein
MARRAGFATAVLLWLAAPAAAEPPPAPTTAEAAAKAAAKAVEAKDEAGLRALAERDDPDPWMVADAILAGGGKEAAEAFAKAAPRKDVERLPAYVAAWTATPAEATAREAVRKGNAALGAGRFAEALEAFSAAPAEAGGVARLRCGFGAGLALSNLGKPADAADRFLAVASEAEATGWLARASLALQEAARTDASARRMDRARDTTARLTTLETARGGRSGLAIAHRTLGRVEAEAGRWDAAHAAYTAALAGWKQAGDRLREAATWNDVAWASRGRKKLADLEDALKASLAISEPAGFSAEAQRSHEIFATAYLDLGLMGGAVKHHRAAVPHAQKSGDALSVARLRFHTGRYLGDLLDFEAAIEPLATSADEYDAMGPSRADGAAAVRARLAWTLAALGRRDEARSHLARTAAAVKATRNPVVQAAELRAQARLLRADGKPADAVAPYRAAKERLDAAQSGTDALLTWVEASDAQREAKDFAGALQTADAATAAARTARDRLALPVALLAASSARVDPAKSAEALDLARAALAAFQDVKHDKGAAAAAARIAELEAGASPK